MGVVGLIRLLPGGCLLQFPFPAFSSVSECRNDLAWGRTRSDVESLRCATAREACGVGVASVTDIWVCDCQRSAEFRLSARSIRPMKGMDASERNGASGSLCGLSEWFDSGRECVL